MDSEDQLSTVEQGIEAGTKIPEEGTAFSEELSTNELESITGSSQEHVDLIIETSVIESSEMEEKSMEDNETSFTKSTPETVELTTDKAKNVELGNTSIPSNEESSFVSCIQDDDVNFEKSAETALFESAVAIGDKEQDSNSGLVSKESEAMDVDEVSISEKDNCEVHQTLSLEVVEEDDDIESFKDDQSSKNDDTGKSKNCNDSGKESTELTILEVSEKEISNEKDEEFENTEFVQISQDKQDDSQDGSQTETQPTEAEDPFAGDNLATESSEPMEIDSTNEERTKETAKDSNKLKESSNAKDVHVAQPTSESKHVQKTQMEIKEFADKIAESTEKSSEKSSDKSSNKSIEKTKPVEKTTKDTTQLSSPVLPGQDDELCIIPDSMKESPLVEKSTDTDKSKSDETLDETQKKTAEENEGTGIHEASKKADLSKEAEKKTDDDTVTSVESANNEKISSPIRTSENVVQLEKEAPDKEASPASVSLLTSDVIDVDDEVKRTDDATPEETCKQCNEIKSCKIKVKVGTEIYNVCSKACKAAFKSANNKATDIPSDGVNLKRDKRCANCLLIVEPKDERNLSWETMEFCNEECLGKFQTKYGSFCRNCNGTVQAVSLGKYCVRFGYDVRQFCCSTCLEEFKKGLKVCSYCQKDISAGTEGFLAPVGDKGQFKDFCTQDCMEKYSRMNSSEPPAPEKKVCGVCQEEKLIHCEVQIDRAVPVAICSEPCFAAFKFVNKVDPDQCSTCKKYFELPNKKNFVVFYEDEAHNFCNKTCLNVFIIANRKIVPCNWCKVKKYNFDMIKKELKTGQVMMMCSLNCLTLYQVSINAVSARRINCDCCKEFSQAQYHLTMSDATIRNFCSYNCVMNFQAQYTKSPITIPSGDDPVPTGMPKRTIPRATGSQPLPITPKPPEPQNIQKKTLPVISSVTSLAMSNGQPATAVLTSNQSTTVNAGVQPLTIQGQTQIVYKQQIISRPLSPVDIGNKMTQCKPVMHTKGVSVRPIPCTKETQTDEIPKVIIPVPVPIYVPFPVHMYTMPFPVPVPVPIPIPVPIFIPTTRNSAKGIFKEIKRIQEKIPSDPFEAELLMMAEMVATEKKTESDSDSEDENREDTSVPANEVADGDYSPEVDSNNAFGEDMLQMALKLATGELEEPAVDLDTALTSSTIQATQPATDATTENDVQSDRTLARVKKRTLPYKPRSVLNKRIRRSSGTNDIAMLPPAEPQGSNPRYAEPVATEKPDANMALKYTFGVNAWRQWVITKNAELEKQSTPTRKLKLFKTDLLQLTADELNYSLCLFIKEVRKPSGAEYAPDTIYYLCLGIQQYLFENNRIDNIFTDAYYEKFTDTLNEVAKKFSNLYNDAQYIVTRVEEEHLWECKQLGAHSPHVLLSTLMFFNTKHFNLVTVEEHMQLSFSHIMKHWKRNPAAQPAAVAGKVPGSRNVLLRFYPPQSALEANAKKKKVYEQQENEDNPLRCPVKLYEFYLSKCPESVKTRNDVFYLLPERSCVPDSPVWYSTSPLAKEHLVKMLNRIKMVKEINVALLSS